MADEVDWSLATFKGIRRRHRERFAALSFREKMLVVEQLAEVAEHFALRRRGRPEPEAPSKPPSAAEGARGLHR